MSRPTRVICSGPCRREVASAEASEVLVLLTRHKGGSLGAVSHVTTTGIWFCNRCTHATPFDLSVLTRLREQLSRGPPTEQRSLLA